MQKYKKKTLFLSGQMSLIPTSTCSGLEMMGFCIGFVFNKNVN